jgi:hypothetical protein
MACLDSLEGLHPVLGRIHSIAGLLQLELHYFADMLLIVDYEDALAVRQRT